VAKSSGSILAHPLRRTWEATPFQGTNPFGRPRGLGLGPHRMLQNIPRPDRWRLRRATDGRIGRTVRCAAGAIGVRAGIAGMNNGGAIPQDWKAVNLRRVPLAGSLAFVWASISWRRPVSQSEPMPGLAPPTNCWRCPLRASGCRNESHAFCSITLC
jgi:hypothetical protein